MSRLVLLSLLLTICGVNSLETAESFEVDSTDPYRLPNTTEPLKYEILLEPNLEDNAFTFTGESKITFRVLESTNSFALNSRSLNITSKDVNIEIVESSNTTQDAFAEKIKGTVTPVPDRELLNVICDKKLEFDRIYRFELKFAGELNDKNVGFYRSRYRDAKNKIRWIATTHFEPTRARMAFPCWDEPAYKAKFTIKIRHLKSYTAISNMPLANKANETDTYLSTFQETPKMSSYLVAFVVSDYLKNERKKFGVWTKPNAINQTEYALDMGEKVLEKLDNYTNIAYDTYMPKMDQISIMDFNAGAMENWGLVTYRESRLLYEDGVTTALAKQNILTVIAHEFTHQWFGNLVSPAWWKYIWLNEGFANYFQYYISDRLEPEWRLMELLVIEALQGRAFITDANVNTRAMNHDVSSPAEISNLFDDIAYQKAGSVIRMMSHILSESNFRDGLRKYLTTHALHAAESNDLISTLNEFANKATLGEATLMEIMKEWTDKAGYPVVKVTKQNEQTLRISQEQFLFNRVKGSTRWWIPITYVAQSDPNFSNTAPITWLKPNSESVTINHASKNNWIIFNTQQTGYYRVNYDNENWNLLKEYLNSPNYTTIHPVNRAQLIDDALNNARAGHLNYSIALSLTTYLTQETDYIPWSAAFRNLNFLQTMLRTSNRYEIFKLYVRFALKKVTEKVTYNANSTDSHVAKLLRTNVVKWACKADSKACVENAQEKFQLWLTNSAKNPIDIDLRNTIICAGLRTADETNFNKTLDILDASTPDEDEKKSLFLIMGCSKSKPILKKFLRASLEKDFKVDFTVAVQAVIADNPEGVDIALAVFAEESEKIRKLDNAESTIQSCIQLLAKAITTNDQYLKLSTFLLHDELKPEIHGYVLMNATRNIEWVSSYGREIDNWLVANEELFNSAGTLKFALFLVILSIFITRLY